MTRRRRIAHIRRTVVALSLAIFIALFSGLYVQMAAGRDPVLGSTSTSTATAQAGDSSNSAPPAAVTTSQS